MKSIRGMHDILPNEIKYWQHIYSKAHKILGSANYNEIRTPVLEDTSLFLRSIGENTDIINKEMYTFNDQANRSLTLRPEGTASIARAILQHKLYKTKNLNKLWYIGPMFRYERPQQGRQRQFHQLGLECYGSNSPVLDAETIYLAQQMLIALQCDKYSIEINSIGSMEDRNKYEIELKKYLTIYYNELDDDSKQSLNSNPLKILDSKHHHTKDILQNAPKLLDFLNLEAHNHFLQVQDYLSSFGIEYKINPTLVRGLDYYNNTVFEIKTGMLGTQDTICGGGRYNYLTEQLNGKFIPAIGWGIGIERLLLLIQEKIILEETPLHIYLAMRGHEAIKYGLQLVPLFQLHNLKYEIDLSNSSFQKQIQKASRQNTKICIIVGEDEVKQQQFTLKWLDKHTQTICKMDNIATELSKLKA